MPVKLDACSLIYLAKAELVDLVEILYGEILIPEAVYQEAVVAGKKAGYADALTIEQYVEAGKMKVIRLTADVQRRMGALQLPLSLGAGERETIIEALEEECLAILDDLDSRAAASALGVSLCGSDTVLIEALLRRLVTLQEYEDKATRLAGVMGMRADDLAELLRLGRLIKEAIGNG